MTITCNFQISILTLLMGIVFGYKYHKLIKIKNCKCKDKKKIKNDKYTLPHSHSHYWYPSKINKFPFRLNDSSGTLILLRHGQSVWNRKPYPNENKIWRYAGTVDIPLSEVGIQEALKAGEKLKSTPIDIIFCSQMDRAKTTVSLALSCHDSGKIPIIQNNSPLDKPKFEGINDLKPEEFVIPTYVTPELNERHFGDLQGVPSSKHCQLVHEETMKNVRNKYNIPFPGKKGESSKDVSNRVIPCFENFILPHLKAKRNVLISSHGFALRTLIKYLDNINDDEWNHQMSLEKTCPEECLLLAPTGVPLIYTYIGENKFYRIPQSARERKESLSRTNAPY